MPELMRAADDESYRRLIFFIADFGLQIADSIPFDNIGFVGRRI
jgi:hypothetical protein